MQTTDVSFMPRVAVWISLHAWFIHGFVLCIFPSRPKKQDKIQPLLQSLLTLSYLGESVFYPPSGFFAVLSKRQQLLQWFLVTFSFYLFETFWAIFETISMETVAIATILKRDLRHFIGHFWCLEPNKDRLHQNFADIYISCYFPLCYSNSLIR